MLQKKLKLVVKVYSYYKFDCFTRLLQIQEFRLLHSFESSREIKLVYDRNNYFDFWFRSDTKTETQIG